jgi:hypothetical protein
MNVFFDFELEDDFKNRTFSLSAQAMFDEIKSFIIERFSIVAKEMQKEESAKTAFVVISIVRDGIAYVDYSKELQNKLQACLSKEDINYLNLRLSEIRSSLLN